MAPSDRAQPRRAGDTEPDRAAHRELMALFDALCDAPPAEQTARIAALRRDDPPLGERLARMLEADRLDTPELDTAGGAAKLIGRFEGSVVAERWRLTEPLGRGGGGEVWRATDLRGGADVAVKLIDPELMANPRQVRRFRREFRALSRLDHEGCLRVLTEGALAEDLPTMAAARRYIVMEYVGGGDLTRLVRAPDAVLMPVLLQLASALDYVHRQQIVHRDLKPANVLLTSDPTPRVKLADFGVIKLSERPDTQITDEATLIGTLDYLSPEQVQGQAVDARSDLYALGCLIHALWTGDVPFGGNRMERLWARVEHDGPALASRAPEAPPALCALADELTRADPARRPQSANEVVRRLYALMPTQPAGSPGDGVPALVPPVGQGAFLFPPGLVGRDAELQSLRDAGRRARAEGCAHLVTVIAPAGLGKSTLVTTFARRLASDGWSTLQINAAEELGRAPFEPLPTLERRLAAWSRQAVTEPAARDVEAPAARPDQEARRAARRLAARLAGRLEQLAAEHPVCVVLEDLHLANAGAAAVLASLVALLAAGRLPVLLLATGRPHVRPLIAPVPTAVVELAPLDPVSSVRVIARILGAPTGELPDDLTRHLVAEALGSPLLLRAAVRELAESGGLERTQEGWSVCAGASPAATVRSLLERRLAALGATARGIVETAAAVGVRFDADLVATVAGAGEDTLLDALTDGVRLGLFAPSSSDDGRDTYLFDHARVAEIALAQVDAPRRAALHDAVGHALLARGAPVAALAYHFARGTDAALALNHLDAAVAEARAA